MADPAGRILMVANPGGHLQQLLLLDKRLPFDQPRLWITAETPQTRALLESHDVQFVSDVGSRQYGALLRIIPHAVRLLREQPMAAAVSTGSGLALGFLPVAAARGISTHYIESATRTDGPSLTGKLLSRVPRVNLYTQHENWADDNWNYPGSGFDGFELVPAQSENTPRLSKVVVSLGTSRHYGFRRLVERLVGILPTEAEVLWQTGCTDTEGLGIATRDTVPGDEFAQAIREADLVVAHAGTGIALSAFNAGKCPVLVAREFSHDEHVDDHQQLTADLLDRLGLAVVRRIERLDRPALELAAGQRVERRAGAAGTLKLRV